jgi:hypothetical protein
MHDMFLRCAWLPTLDLSITKINNRDARTVHSYACQSPDITFLTSLMSSLSRTPAQSCLTFPPTT